jgi:hypothetical protein
MDMTPMSLHICGVEVEVQEAVMAYVKGVQALAEVMFEQISLWYPVTLLK